MGGGMEREGREQGKREGRGNGYVSLLVEDRLGRLR